MAPALVFDVNETLLDLAGLDGLFERRFGDRAVRREWFSQMLHAALVATVTGRYLPFGEHGSGALATVAGRHGVELRGDDGRALREGMLGLPPHPDARPALERLRAGGVRLAALTNSTLEVAEAQLSNAGLGGLFDTILSADSVQRLKPAREPYAMAAERLGIAQDELVLVAAHGWDVAGALAAGARAVFVARPGQGLLPGAPAPERTVRDLSELPAP